MSFCHFIAFAVLLTHSTIFQVQGQSTVQGYDIGDSSINIVEEIQRLRLLFEAFSQHLLFRIENNVKLSEQVQGIQEFDNATSQEKESAAVSLMRTLQAIDRRLNDHDIYIKNQTEVSVRSLQAVDRRLQEHEIYIKNQNDNCVRSLQADDRRLDDHIKNQTDIIMRSLQGVDRRLNDHEIYIRNQTDISVRNLQVVDRRLDDHIKNQTNITMKSLEAVDRRLSDHEIYIKNQTDISVRSLQAIDHRLDDHDIHIRNQTEISLRNLQAIDRRLNDHDIHIKNQTDISMRSLQAIDRRLQEHDIYMKNKTHKSDVCSRPKSPIIDCSDIRARGHNESGVYQVYVRDQLGQFCVNAFCDMETTDGKWLVFQRRKDGSEDFYRAWSEYAAGFGDPSGEFWLGNEMLHLLTTKRNYRLRIDLEDFEGQTRYAEYSRFVIGSSADNYSLTLGSYSGNAGDSLTYHNGMQFTTKDADHDTYARNCAQLYKGAWWHGPGCYYANLNGIYRRGINSSPNADGVIWYHWHDYTYSLKTTEMKIAPVP